MTTSIKGMIFALLCAICWSFTGLVTKIVPLSVYVISGIEGLTSFVFLLYIKRNKIKITPYVLMVGLIQFLMHITFAIANKYCNIGNAIVLQYSSMIFILFYQFIDKHKKPQFYQIIVILLSIIGMVIFFYDSISFKNFIGSLLAVISGAFFGLQFYLNTKEKANPDISNIVQFGFAVIGMFAYFLITKETHITINQVLQLISAGVICGLFASLCFAKCIKYISAFSANVICMSEIVFASVWGLIFLHEAFTRTSLIGAVFMVTALIYNKYKEYKLGEF